MKKLALSCFLLAFMPLQAKAFVPISQQSELLSYVAMPLAVSSVCDVRGVQTDRVGELVSYMNQANVPPAAFDDVFRYVPVALVMRTDRHPDFVEWVHGQVVQGVTGPALVSAMETQLGTYGNGITVVSNRYPARDRRDHRSYVSNPQYAYNDYAYRDVFAEDYVPVVVRRYSERQLVEPMALIDMPLAVADAYDLGVPVQRVSSLARELNLGGVPPLQFVELFRYAPAALAVDTAYAPDLVTYVHTQQVAGVYGLPLVQVIDRQLPVYGVNPQIDLTSPGYYYSPDNYYVPTYAPTAPQYMAQYYVPPADPAYVPQVVQTRIASGFAAGGANYALPQQTAPAIAAPQVQRLLNAQNGAPVVMNPVQARREIAHANRAQAFAQNRGHNVALRPPLPAQASPTAHMMRGVGRGRHVGTAGVAPATAAPVRVHGNGHGRGHAVAAAPSFVQPAPQPQFHGKGGGHGHGGGPPMAVAPAPVPAVVAAPQHGGGGGNGHVPPGQEKKGKGH
jgi:hypothetical protein